MSYTVGQSNYEKKSFENGTYVVEIKSAKISDSRFTNESFETIGIKPQQIGILLAADTGESGFDNINQFINKETLEVEFSQAKMNAYSNAIGIEVGTTFDSIQSWLDYIVGKRVQVDIELNANGYPKVKSVNKIEKVEVEKELPF